MEIKGMRKINGESKIKAFFSVEFPGKLTINDCKMVEGKNGIFVAMPSREYTNKQGEKKWQNIVYVEQELLNKINVAAELEYYGKTSPKPTSAPDDSDFPF